MGGGCRRRSLGVGFRFLPSLAEDYVNWFNCSCPNFLMKKVNIFYIVRCLFFIINKSENGIEYKLVMGQ